MAKRLQLRRGTTAQHETFIGAVGEVTVDTTRKTLIVHDGVTTGTIIPTFANVASEISAGLAAIATQGVVNTATDDTRFVTPKKLFEGLKSHLNVSGGAPMYACRAWVNFNGTGTVAIRDSGNVSSITDNGVSDYTINFTTAMQDANYSASVSGIGQAGSNNQWYGSVEIVSMTASALRIAQSSTTLDPSIVCASIFR